MLPIRKAFVKICLQVKYDNQRNVKAEKQKSQSKSKKLTEVSDSCVKSIFSATNKSMADVVNGEDAIFNTLAFMLKQSQCFTKTAKSIMNS